MPPPPHLEQLQRAQLAVALVIALAQQAVGQHGPAASERLQVGHGIADLGIAVGSPVQHLLLLGCMPLHASTVVRLRCAAKPAAPC